MLESLTDDVTRIVETAGYLGVALLVAAESVIPPIPSELVLPLSGFVARRSQSSVLGMVVAATIGSVVGAWLLYAVSAAVGPDRLRGLVERRGRWLGVSTRDLERAERWFDRRAALAVAVGRCIPLIRSIVSVPAGVRRMPFIRFTVLTAIGSAVWNGVLIGMGAALGDQWHRVGDVVALVQVAVIVGAGSVLVTVVWRRTVRPRLISRAEARTPAQ